MDNVQLQELKNGLSTIKQKFRLLAKAKGRDKTVIGEDLTRMADVLIKEFNLLIYDQGIKDERHKIGFFINDVERIISAIERNKGN